MLGTGGAGRAGLDREFWGSFCSWEVLFLIKPALGSWIGNNTYLMDGARRVSATFQGHGFPGVIPTSDFGGAEGGGLTSLETPKQMQVAAEGFWNVLDP